MSFLDQCVQDSLPIWQECLETPFLRQLTAGALDEAAFAGYIVDDSLYLREYARVFAWGMLKGETMADIRACYSLLSFVNEGEGATRLKYLARWGLRDEDIQRLPQRPENRAYTDCMIRATREGEGMAECMMACLPCMLSYGWIFRTIAEQAPQLKDTVFWPLVEDYADPGYDAFCRDWTAYAEQACAGLPRQRLDRCMEIFRQCSLHELRFWQMSHRRRTDIAPVIPEK